MKCLQQMKASAIRLKLNRGIAEISGYAEISALLSSQFDPQLLHARLQRFRVDIQNPGRALFAAHAPSGQLQHLQDVRPLKLLQGGKAGRAWGRLCQGTERIRAILYGSVH